MTYWVARASDNPVKCDEPVSKQINKDIKFVLIDKASHRHKYDNKLKDETPDFEITRIRVDIEDVVLKKVSDIRNRVSIHNPPRVLGQKLVFLKI